MSGEGLKLLENDPINEIIAFARDHNGSINAYWRVIVERLCAEVERLQEMYESGSDLSEEEIRQGMKDMSKPGFDCDMTGMPERSGYLES